jgi:uncharacterized protein involved in exopolysaccharide biosynthesis
MNEVKTVTPGVVSGNETGFGLFDLVIALARRKKLIVGLPIVVAALAAVASGLLPNVYQANTKLLPPQQSQSGAAALLSQLGGVAGAAAGVAGIKAPNDLYIGMLRSRTVADQIISKFDLKKVYEVDTLERARKKLEEKTYIISGKDGLISIAVEDNDPQRVAQLANGYVDQLNKLTQALAVTESSQRRIFFEQQLLMAKNNLAAAEMKLKGVLDTRGIVSVDSDSRSIVETIGRVRAQLSAKQIQLDSMNAFVTENNPEYKRVEQELSSLRSELSKLENGRPAVAGNADAGSKRAGINGISLLRDVQYYQMLYDLLAKQYEVARLDEAKDPSIIQVLDPAIKPERKSKPNRSLLVLVSAAISFLLVLAWGLFSELKRHALTKPQTAARFAALKANLKAW